MHETTTKLYKQSIVFEDFDFSGPADLFNEYDVLFNIYSLYAKMDSIFIDDENSG